MSRSYWNSNNTFVDLVVIFSLLVCVGIAGFFSNPSATRSHTDKSNQQAEDADTQDDERTRQNSISIPNVSSISGEKICREAETPQQYDLCQQWRMANAAEEAADIAWKHYTTGIIGLCGLLATVLLAAWSARSASSAARAAARSVQTIVDSERPIVQIARIDLKGKITNEFGLVLADITFKNFGKTSCWLQGVFLDYRLGAEDAELDWERRKNFEETRMSCFLPQGGELRDSGFTDTFIQLEKSDLDAIRLEEEWVIVFGYTKYRGMGGRIWTSRFGFYIGFTLDWESPNRFPCDHPAYWIEELEDPSNPTPHQH